MAHHFFTSESVTEGHPDKICDQISDAILNEILTQDPYARVACETTCTTGMVQVMGEISTSCYVDIPKVVRDTVREIGYDRAKYGFDCDTCGVLNAIHDQSPDIAQKYGVMSVPTLMVFENGQVKNQAVGVQPKQNILSMIG